MTLIEVMIAVVLLAFVVIGATSITQNSQNAKDRTIQTNRDNIQIETVFSRLDWDFSQVWSPLYFSQQFQGNLDPQANPGVEEIVYLYENHPRFRLPSKEGLPIPIFRSREKTEVIFLTTGNRRKLENQRQSNFMWVRYYLGDTPADEANDEDPVTTGGSAEGTTKKSLLRQTFTEDVWSKEEFDFENTRSSVMLENVESLEFQFWNQNTRKWTENLKTITDGEHLIRGIKVLVTWFDGRGSKRTAERWLRPNWPITGPKDAPTAATTAGRGGGGVPGGVNGGQAGGANGTGNGGPGGGQPGDIEEI